VSEMKWLVSNWKFKASDDNKWLPAQVPGCVHTDLLRNDVISNPFEGTNEKELQWIDRKDWEYVSEFDSPAELLVHSHLELVFEGLDTYAEVYLNDKHVLSADNMFRTWKADVKPLLRAAGNKLRIVFRSPIHEGLAKLEALGYGYPATNDHSEIGGLGDKKLSIFTRKAPYHFGWDWGPRFVTSGIGKDISVQGWTGFRVTDLFIRQEEVTAASARMTAVVEIQSEIEGAGELKLGTDGGHHWEQQVKLVRGSNRVEWAVEIINPKLWWSRGLGEPQLYTFDVSLSLSEDESANARKSVRIGLRSIKLVRTPDKYGSSFYFELNGIPVFAKGANHIPNDSFFTEVTTERYRHEIASAVESNFNMLRVWGGGIYEQDVFYEFCDEYGIMVWQDFMFACSMYPGDQAFLDNVRGEAEDNIRRLRNHACIVLWCGNNEIDGAWSQYDENAGWGWKKLYSAEIREQLWANYEAVFHQVLPEVVSELAPGIDYWPSSPMQGVTNNAAQHATNKSSHGDIHFWAVWHASEPFENYKLNIGRFMSEYGFQSFPEYKTVKTYASDKEMALESEVMLHHQKNKRGNQLIKEYSDRYCKDPKDFVSFLYMSQVLQAEGMKMAIEAHRRNMDYCMGTLYWQMNDCWPVASWSSMDYYGRWKAIQYFAKKSFRDVMLSFDLNEDVVEFHVVSDIQKPINGTLVWSLYDFQGNLLEKESHPIEVPANTAVKVLDWALGEWMGNYNPNQTVLVGEVIAAGELLDSKEHYFSYSKHLELTLDPSIEVAELEGSAGTEFVLTTRSLAKQVWLQSEEEGIFSDNFFDLVPGIPKTIQFLKRDTGGAAFAPASPGRLEVKSMVDFIG
jgi:beta-mannosidase